MVARPQRPHRAGCRLSLGCNDKDPFRYSPVKGTALWLKTLRVLAEQERESGDRSAGPPKIRNDAYCTAGCEAAPVASERTCIAAVGLGPQQGALRQQTGAVRQRYLYGPARRLLYLQFIQLRPSEGVASFAIGFPLPRNITTIATASLFLLPKVLLEVHQLIGPRTQPQIIRNPHVKPVANCSRHRHRL